jgi:phospholipase/lecithinase/hemolysin
MLLIKLGLDDGSILGDPNYVLDAKEVAVIQQRIEIFNAIIDEQVANIGMPVADIKSLFDEASTNPPVIFGIPVTARFLGGFFSLDAVHPSNIAQAILANAFIETINTHFQKNIPLIDQKRLETIFLQDPFIDKDGDLKVRGRLLAGLLETLAPFLGISGDFNDSIPNISQARIDRDRGQRFIEIYRWLQGKDRALAAEWTKKDTIEAFRHIFGLRGFENTSSHL